MRNFRRILSYAREYKSYAILNVIFNLLYVFFNLLSLLLFIPFLRLIFYDSVEEKLQPTMESAGGVINYAKEWYEWKMYDFVVTEGKIDALAFVCVTIILAFFFKNLFRYLAMFFLANVRNGVVKELRADIYQKLLALHVGFFSEERKGDIISRATSDVQEVEFSVMSSLELIFREPIAIVINIAALLYISVELTLFSFILLPISALVIGRISKSLKKSAFAGQERLGDLLTTLEETLGALRIVKGFNAEQQMKDRFEEVNNGYRNEMLKAYRKKDLASPLNEFLGSIVMIGLVWFGGNMILDPGSETSMTGDAFIGFVIVFSQLLRPIQGTSSALANINKGLAAMDRINKVLHAENKIVETPDAKPVEGLKEKIEYTNVAFSYLPDEPVLKDVTFTLSKGKTIALVGESGGGKSTIADLLPRFYDCTSGAISVDGVDIRNLKIADLRRLMGVVTQDSILFNDTIYNNIAFGGKDITEEQVIEAAKIANAHDFISEFPRGYNTNIGDSGGKLSGGQKQRVSIARAVLANPDILILDEATSALDTESEKLVQQALEKLMQNRTSLVIAHRLSTIQHADEILVIQKGEIVERGDHETLLSLGGVYKKLSDLQSFA